jgi:septal ring factor EnvC (AmiA/AmiB activator)
MTTINDINDLARILREQPEWADTLRSLLLTQELLDLPAKFSEMVDATRAINNRLSSLEGRFSNMEGNDYERRVRYRVLNRATTILGMEDPQLTLTQNDPESPALSAAISQALRDNAITREEAEDLHDTDIIISAQGNRHLAVEVSMTPERYDFERARRRALLLQRVTGGTASPVVVTRQQMEPPELPGPVTLMVIQ